MKNFEKHDPMCGRLKTGSEWDSEIPSDIIEIKNQIQNLEETLRKLKDEEISVAYLEENKILMCPVCQKIMQEIYHEKSRKELEERINRQIEKLEEHIEDLTKGMD